MLDLKEEARYDELKDKCRGLRIMPPPDIFINLKIHDKNDNLIFDDTQRGHSWTRNIWNNVFGIIVGYNSSIGTTIYGPSQLNNILAVTENIQSMSIYSFLSTGNAGDDLNGIAVGRSGYKFNIHNSRLYDHIRTGTGIGLLSYQASTKTNPEYHHPTKTWSMTHNRIFNNLSGETIIVREIANIGKSGAWDYRVWERSVLDPEAELIDGSRLTVIYKFSLDFSSID